MVYLDPAGSQVKKYTILSVVMFRHSSSYLSFRFIIISTRGESRNGDRQERVRVIPTKSDRIVKFFDPRSNLSKYSSLPILNLPTAASHLSLIISNSLLKDSCTPHACISWCFEKLWFLSGRPDGTHDHGLQNAESHMTVHLQ